MSDVGVMKELSILLETDEDKALFDEVMDSERFYREHGVLKRVAGMGPGDLVCSRGVLREAILGKGDESIVDPDEIISLVLWLARGVHVWRVEQVWRTPGTMTLMFDNDFTMSFDSSCELPVACTTGEWGPGEWCQ